VSACLGVALLGLVAACGGEQDGDEDPEHVTVRLVIADLSLRQPDVACSGAGPFRFAHPEARYVVEDSSGKPVASGVLPQGRAEQAWAVDLGDRRQPTVCVMMIDVSGLVSVDGHSLVIGDWKPKPIEPNPSLDDVPEVVLS
jgi:hypothetical protein